MQFCQLRREDEFVGPIAEIEYWRAQLARFNSIVEFVETEDCKKFIEFLEYVSNRHILKVILKLFTHYKASFAYNFIMPKAYIYH